MTDYTRYFLDDRQGRVYGVFKRVISLACDLGYKR